MFVEFQDESEGWDSGEVIDIYMLEDTQSKTPGASLAEIVAREKAENIHNLRPSIGKLGRKKLESMILHIFAELIREDYQDGEVARLFGLNKASFSRFAGSRWSTSRSRKIPDLWQNTAHTVAGNPSFLAAAKEARVGVWERIQAVVNNTTQEAGRSREVE